MQKGWLEISDLDQLINFSRKIIYFNFDEQNQKMPEKEFFEQLDLLNNEQLDEMNKILPYTEVKNIFNPFLIKKKHKKTKKLRIFIKEQDYSQVLEEIGSRLVSNIVHNMVCKGVLDSAFDDEKNDFVFWVKRHEQKNN